MSLSRSHRRFCWLLLVAMAWSAPVAQAQLVPDVTLGDESSSISTDQRVQGDLADVIEGGAARGNNLFHSFSEFNVNDGQRVYFANPAEIESILSRVTGNNPSEIFGTLGIDGSAALFLINPNGLIFGENAQLDIPGSFYGTTAEAVELGNGVFSATAPTQSQLLAVSPSVSFWNYLTENSGNIINRGALAVEEDLVLAGNQLDLESQIAAIGNVSLLATDAIKIRDTAETPFIAFAGEDFLVQGNQQVDIIALSHPDSGLFSYGNIVLRSADRVGGDAHYFSGGDFRVEELDGGGGELFSPMDPIIRVLGDVFIEEYEGSSLHILAGGSVQVSLVIITAPETGEVSIDFLQEIIRLSDETEVTIDGSAQPTIDIRAGILSTEIGTPSLEVLTGLDLSTDIFRGSAFVTPSPSSADIVVGSIGTLLPNGLVLLTNQYKPNVDLPGDIRVTGEGLPGVGISVANLTGQGGTVFVNSRGNFTVTNGSINTASTDNVGDIVVIADETVTFDGLENNLVTGALSSVVSGEQGLGGNIQITAKNLEILNGAQLTSAVLGEGQGGNIFINVAETSLIQGFSPINNSLSGVYTGVEGGGRGQGGDIWIRAQNLELRDGGTLSSSILDGNSAGNIFLEIDETAIIEGGISGISSSVFANNTPGEDRQGGDITLSAANLNILNGAQLNSSTFGVGDAGNIILDIRDTARFQGASPINGVSTRIESAVGAGAIGQGGNIQITARNLEVLDSGQLITSSLGVGDSGNITLEVDEAVRLRGVNLFNANVNSGIYSNTDTGSVGRSGEIQITANSLEVLNGAQIDSSTSGIGDASDVLIMTRESVLLQGADLRTSEVAPSAIFSRVESSGAGQGGDIRIATNRLQLSESAQLGVSNSGIGNAGNIILEAATLDVLNGASLDTETGAIGNAGDIILKINGLVRFVGVDPITGFTSQASSSIAREGEGQGGIVNITADALEVLNGAQLNTAVFGIGNAGDVVLDIHGSVRFEGSNPINNTPSGASSSIQPTSGKGESGDIIITATNLDVLNGAQLGSSSLGIGNAGDVILNIQEAVRLIGNDPTNDRFTGIFGGLQSGSVGTGGDIRLSAGDLEIRLASLSSRSAGQGNAGDLILDIRDRIQVQDGTITTNAEFNAGGQIQIDAGIISLFGDSDIQTFVNSGTNNGGDITITADAVVALDDSDILAFAADGRGGNVDLSRTAFFGQDFSLAPFGTDPRTLDGNNRVDINATGRLASGNILLPDVSFIQNTLTELPDNLVNPETLVSNSCIARSNDTASSFTLTGSNGLPSNSPQPSYSLSTVQPTAETTNVGQDIAVLEPHQVYQLSDGRLVISRECNEID
ncbi:MAG: filamentous hemagglutinin N-terminal domain-containing protein [Cyanobacteria bacterium P01_B01_bin.77]